VSIKLKRDKAEKKPELTDTEIVEIREALKSEPAWMQRSFEIALHTGCRLRETRIPRACVDFDSLQRLTPKTGYTILAEVAVYCTFTPHSHKTQ
jgi:hypothetical protein